MTVILKLNGKICNIAKFIIILVKSSFLNRFSIGIAEKIVLLQLDMRKLGIVKRIKNDSETGDVGKLDQSAFIINETVDLPHTVEFIHYINVRNSTGNALIIEKICLLCTGIAVHMPHTKWIEMLVKFINCILIEAFRRIDPSSVMSAGDHTPDGRIKLTEANGIGAEFADKRRICFLAHLGETLIGISDNLAYSADKDLEFP